MTREVEGLEGRRQESTAQGRRAGALSALDRVSAAWEHLARSPGRNGVREGHRHPRQAYARGGGPRRDGVAMAARPVAGPCQAPGASAQPELPVAQVELKTGEAYRGELHEAEDNWNCQIKNATATAKVKTGATAFLPGGHPEACVCTTAFPACLERYAYATGWQSIPLGAHLHPREQDQVGSSYFCCSRLPLEGHSQPALD